MEHAAAFDPAHVHAAWVFLLSIPTANKENKKNNTTIDGCRLRLGGFFLKKGSIYCSPPVMGFSMMP